MRGARDEALGEALELDADVYGPRLAKWSTEQREAMLAEERLMAVKFLQRMAAEDGAQTLDSGLIFLSLEKGSGAAPSADSVVRLKYRGTLHDGTVFADSLDRGQPMVIVLDFWPKKSKLPKNT